VEGIILGTKNSLTSIAENGHPRTGAGLRMRRATKPWIVLIILLLFFTGFVPGYSIEKAKVAVFIFKPSAEIYDRIMAGVKATFVEVGYRENRSLLFDYYEARRNELQAIKMVEKIRNGNYNIVLSLGTRSTQILQENGLVEVPVLFSGVFDPVNAGIVPSLDGSQSNYAGSSHRQEFSKQFTYLIEMVPSVKRLGIIYRHGEVNSLVQVVEVKSVKDSLGLTEVILSPAKDA
jgi:putative ABC transport system substrate-binding protein